ncbi:hypothetical protein ZIOFF_012049 [Zingiber officinale]|uniref:Uncharacterized protein n=1 Tax=Zingiber officinale TaxID=94328 RepID=A0A8J5LQH3_ZINOF|nr:hypothetical protein ZIOFF_012049 [Zingiber officinale]
MADHNIRLTSLSAFLVLFVLLLQSHIASSQEVVTYQKGREVGPEHWGWTACGKGRMQSPVDLSHERVQVLPLLGLLRRSYRPVVACYKIATTTSWQRWKCADRREQVRFEVAALELAVGAHPQRTQTADIRTVIVVILYTLGRSEPFFAKVLHLMLGTHRVGLIWALECMQGRRK